MSKKVKIILCAVCLAVVAMVASFCFIFLGNTIIDDVPQLVSVQKIGEEYFLITDYMPQYLYEYKLEQKLDGEYVLLKKINTDQNMVNLSKQDLTWAPGVEYRFSVCFATENGAGNSDYSAPLEWVPTWKLDAVDNESIQLDLVTAELSWDAVDNADFYILVIVDAAGREQMEVVESTSFDMSAYATGRYKVYLSAYSTTGYFEISDAGLGKEIVIEKQNRIVSTEMKDSGELEVVCTLEVSTFEIYEDGVLKMTVDAGRAADRAGNKVYTITNAQIVFNSLDFENKTITIKSLRNGGILESRSVEIEL